MPQKKGLFTKEVDIKISKVLTQIISPVVSSVIGLYVLYKEYIYAYHGPSYSWVITVTGIFFASIGTLYFFLRNGKVSNWDISDRRQRPKVLALFMCYVAILVASTWILGYYEALPFLILFTASLALASVITLYWKVSFHTFAVTLCTMFVLLTYNRPELYFLVILPFITAWTRIVLRKHTPAQAVGGIALALFTTSAWILFPVLKRIVERLTLG